MRGHEINAASSGGDPCAARTAPAAPSAAGRRLGLVLLLVIALVSATGACRRGDGLPEGAIKLDGTPRVPSAEGVVEEASRDTIVLDGGRRYRVSAQLQSFDTAKLSTIPLVSHLKGYSQVGLRGNTVTWISKIAPVFSDGTTFYVGVMKQVDGRRLVFRDGTVLTLAPEVKVDARRGMVQADIDARAHVVRAVTGR